MKNGEGQNLSRFGFKVTRIFWWTGLIEVPRRHGHCGALIVPRAHVPAISAWSLQLYGQFVPFADIGQLGSGRSETAELTGARYAAKRHVGRPG